MKINSEIKQIADDVLAKYVKKGGGYKMLNEIMTAEDIKFREVNSANSDFVGALTKANSGQTYIMVNKAIDNEGRKHFTIAHELGHYFLSHQLTQNSFYCLTNEVIEEGELKNSIEQEANYFASSFLMPEQKVKDAFLSILGHSSRGRIKDFLYVKNDFTYGIWRVISDTLTKRYRVSEMALRYRLRELKLAKFEFIERLI